MRHLLLASCLFALPLAAQAQVNLQPGQSVTMGGTFTPNLSFQDALVAGGQTVNVAPPNVTTPVYNNITVPGGVGGAAAGYTGTASNTVTIHNPHQVPTPYAPTITNYNVCQGRNFSGSVTTGLFGFGFGASGEWDRICQLHTLGDDATARELLCQDSDVRRAALAAGRPCARDRQQVAIQPAAAPLPTPGGAATPSVGRPLYCSHLSAAEQARAGYRAICSAGYPEPIMLPTDAPTPRQRQHRG